MLTGSEVAIDRGLLRRLSEARHETDRLFGIVKQGSLYDRPIPERHRIVFYIGHLEAFDWNLLRETLHLGRFSAEYDKLFAFGIDPVDGSLPNDQPCDWPTLVQVESYRRRIRRELDDALSDADATEELIQLLNIAIEHRLMHAETLEYMFHQLTYAAKRNPNPSAGQIRTASVTPAVSDIPGGAVTLGLKRSAGQFGWDNEFESQTLEVPAFSIDQYKVTNGEFLKFVESGGYSRPSYWSAADWEWITETGVRHPVFWVPTGSEFRYRSMFEEIPLPIDSAVFVSYAEASAYARWAGKDLSTEAEWQRAAEGAKPPQETRQLWDPPPVGAQFGSGSQFGVEGLFGTGWEWTRTAFAPFPGFRAHPAYPGYSANFFDGQHYVMKGGSTRTAACLLRKSFRNWFQPHYQYVYAGFRCVTR
jgi:ergothioneine biosynthesis protein EgtB